MGSGDHIGAQLDIFICQVSGQTFVEAGEEKLPHGPHDVGETFRSLAVNVVFRIYICLHETVDAGGAGDE